jgi:hypothetical protein
VSTKTTVKYLDDSQHSLQFVNKDGDTITANPFDAIYGDIAERLANIIRTNGENARARKNYEDAVKNAQQNVVEGRPYDPLPPAPECEFWPDDYTLPGTTIPWTPPLAVITPITIFKSGQGASQTTGAAKVDDATRAMIVNMFNLLVSHPEYGDLVRELAASK